MASEFAGLPRIDLRGDDPTQREQWLARCRRSAGLSGEADAVAREVIAAVLKDGDQAIVELTQRFEGRQVSPSEFEVPTTRRFDASGEIDPKVRRALELARNNILRFHRTQLPKTTELKDKDTLLQSRVAPLRSVAVYAPGGTAAYPSSVLMAAVPAKVAGVPDVILLTPRASHEVLVAAELAGVDRVFEIGGAQAIAAAAVGTATIPRVDKIVGPGNAYVTAAKRQVFGLCDIDSIAGPSEILVLADASADPEVVVADLLSQAEHDKLACAVLVTDHEELITQTHAALTRQLADLPRAEIALASLRDHGAAVLTSNRAEMIAEANAYAPEHLELLVDNAEDMCQAIVSAGAIFVGPWTPEAAGDYTAGPSHVLPTAGVARFGSPLGVWDFVKYTSVLQLNEAALARQADAIMALARAEGLEGHARAVQRRLKRS